MGCPRGISPHVVPQKEGSVMRLLQVVMQDEGGVCVLLPRSCVKVCRDAFKARPKWYIRPHDLPA